MRYQTKRKSFFTSLLLSPPVIVFLISSFLIIFNLYETARIRPFNSDDVSWQNILLTWHPFNGHLLSLGGSDNFILKVPLFAVLAHFFSPGRKLLFLESGILALTTFTLFYSAALYFLKKASIKLTYGSLLPFVWLASFGYSVSQLYLNPILRNFEIGLSFISFVLAAMLYYKELDPLRSFISKSLMLFACLISGMLIYNDPYFLYFTVIPIAGLYSILYLLKKVEMRRLFIVYAYAVLSLAFAKLTAFVALKAGIRLVFNFPVQFIGFDQFFSNIALGLHSLLLIFGADFFGRPLLNIVTVSALANFAVITFIAYYLCRFRKRSAQEGAPQASVNTWIYFFGLLNLFVLSLYVISTVAVDLNTYRYLIILVFSSVLLLAMLLNSVRGLRPFVLVVIAASIVVNVATSIQGYQSYLQPGAINNTSNSLDYAMIDAVKAQGLKKGYAPYWDGHINTYLSGGKIEFLPIVCINGQTSYFHWLVDESQFNKPATRSFYIIDPDLPAPPVCSEDQLIKQFGEPAKTIVVSDKTILVYNYDILSGVKP